MKTTALGYCIVIHPGVNEDVWYVVVLSTREWEKVITVKDEHAAKFQQRSIIATHARLAKKRQAKIRETLDD